jgi:O-antigen/teichoic acid export membrane protein
MKAAFGFTKRLLHRDFSGYTGMAVKNSIYSFLTSTLAKIGSLLFTAVLIGSTFLVKIFSLFSIELKPLLSPELFGLYSLSLSTILIFAGFSDLGIGSALVRYISKYDKNSRGYIYYLAKLKIILTSIVALALIASSYFIANFYQKPIFLALLAGSAYIMSTSLLGFISGFFQAENNFRIIFNRELLFQVLRLIIVPTAIIYSLAYSSQFILFVTLLSLSLCSFLALLFLKLNLKKYHGKRLKDAQRKEVNKFILPLTVTALSGTFFGYIDIIMLGRFVEAINIAYYQAAFALLGSGITILSFSAVLFPIFSRLKGARLLSGLKKSILVTIPISIAGGVFTYLIASLAISYIYNADYLPAVNILQILAVLFLTDPLISIYSSFFVSEGKSYFVAKVLIISTLINITLNYFLIKALLPYGDYIAVFGAVAATIISRIFYLGMFIFKRFNS